MVLPEQAAEAAKFLSDRVTNYRSGEFFRENPGCGDLTEGAEALVGFLLERPAMLVSDAQNKEVILGFLDKEWYEAEHAENVEGPNELFGELGDTVFFALLSGILHWDEMDSEQRDFVQRAMRWSEGVAAVNSVNINDAVVYVAKKKDPANYRKEFYQLHNGEKTGGMNGRVAKIGKLHRKIRTKLNGEWSGSDDLPKTLMEYWSINKGRDVTVIQIAALFELAGLDLAEWVT